MSRIAVRKTYKLYIGGAFPRSESGRTYEAEGQNVAWASRKDARDAVKAARGAFSKWAGATPYNRGQVLYRLAEMMETRVTDLARACSGRREVERAIDRVVWYAGWADKLPQVLGGSNPVAGPYFNFTVPEPTGVVAVLAPEVPALEGLVSRIAPVIVSGNTTVVVASETQPLAALELAEAIATSDLPGGVVNLLTGYRAELAPILASHMDVNAIDVTGAGDSGARTATTPVGSGTVKLKYGPATGLEPPSTCGSLSAQPAYQTTRSIARSTSRRPEQARARSVARVSIISARR